MAETLGVRLDWSGLSQEQSGPIEASRARMATKDWFPLPRDQCIITPLRESPFPAKRTSTFRAERVFVWKGSCMHRRLDVNHPAGDSWQSRSDALVIRCSSLPNL